jgi:hypothetical protein
MTARILLATALRCADLIEDAYHAEAPRPWPVVEAVGYVQTKFLVFRGTQNAHDWEVDIEAWQIEESWTDGAQVHKGFAGLTDHYYDLAHDSAMGAAFRPVRPQIVLTGHSLGAALAVLTAYRLKRDLPNMNLSVVAFGCPRVGNEQFHQQWHNRVAPTVPCVRIYHDHDPVAHVPGIGYRHVGEGLHLDNDGSVLPDTDTFFEKLRYWLTWDPFAEGIGHKMDLYRGALYNFAAKHTSAVWLDS